MVFLLSWLVGPFYFLVWECGLFFGVCSSSAWESTLDGSFFAFGFLCVILFGLGLWIFAWLW